MKGTTRLLLVGAVLAASLVGTTAWAAHNASETIHVCIKNSNGQIREGQACGSNETAHVLLTEAALAGLQAAIGSLEESFGDRLDALETGQTEQDDRLDALEGANAALQDEVDALGEANADLQAQVADLEDRIGALEAATAPVEVTFTKIHDGGHYASYTVTGSGFQPGSTVTSGVGTTTTVTSDGTFSVFGGNLFCADQVSVSGTAANGDPVTRTHPVECNNEQPSSAAATFTKIHDGGHYASYRVSGTGFQPGSVVTSGVGTTQTVAGDGTFTNLFGGNLFCADQVSVSGTDGNGNPVTLTHPVECDNE